jgi:hypothetical protein
MALTREQPDDKRYLPGNGPWKVGDRVRFLGVDSHMYPGYDRDGRQRLRLRPDGSKSPAIFHTGQRKVEVGETAIVIKDHGFSYRYTLALDLDGLVVRPGPGRWELIELGSPDELLEDKEVDNESE